MLFIAELAQFMFGIASFPEPARVHTYLIHELNPDIYKEGKNFFIDLLAGMTPADMPWVSLLGVHSSSAGDAGCRRPFPFPENRVERR